MLTSDLSCCLFLFCLFILFKLVGCVFVPGRLMNISCRTELDRKSCLWNRRFKHLAFHFPLTSQEFLTGLHLFTCLPVYRSLQARWGCWHSRYGRVTVCGSQHSLPVSMELPRDRLATVGGWDRIMLPESCRTRWWCCYYVICLISWCRVTATGRRRPPPRAHQPPHRCPGFKQNRITASCCCWWWCWWRWWSWEKLQFFWAWLHHWDKICYIYPVDL